MAFQRLIEKCKKFPWRAIEDVLRVFSVVVEGDFPGEGVDASGGIHVSVPNALI
jgi:hypothetical protein